MGKSSNACEDICEYIWDIIKFLVVLAIYQTRVLPSVHLDQLYVPALNTTDDLTRTIYINLRLKNRNHATGVYYDDPIYVNVTFFPKDQNTSIPLGEYGMPGFYQGNGKGKRVMGPLPTRGLPRVTTTTDGGVVQKMQPVGTFRVDFSARVRHKVDGYHQRHSLRLSADVEYDGTIENKFENKDIRLVKSGAWFHKRLSFSHLVPMSMFISMI